MQPPTMWNGPRRRTNREEKSAELPGEPYGLRSITGILHTAMLLRTQGVHDIVLQHIATAGAWQGFCLKEYP